MRGKIDYVGIGFSVLGALTGLLMFVVSYPATYDYLIDLWSGKVEQQLLDKQHD